jgi:nuclear pore complex protein Nup160
LWKPKLGCIASKTLPATPSFQELSASSSSTAKYLLLDAEQQNLVKVFSLTSEDMNRVDIYALVFIPTPLSTSGGFFCLIDTSTDHFVEIGIIECPKHTAHNHLQDFLVSGNTIYALWDRQGQSMVERTEIDVAQLKYNDIQFPIWKTSQYAQEPELTPAYMEEQLLSPGSLTEKFLNAIMKPGVFSSLTLRTALDKYVDACLSIPGPPPPQLLNTYSNLTENIAAVVGCTVTLNRDHQTGGFQHANYWTALKRDWEGFVARCREVERSARWPLAISQGQNGVLVVERERVGSVVPEDIPVCLHRMLEQDQPLHAQFELLAAVWTLRSQLGPRMLSSVESRVIEIMHQEIAFSFAEILQDQSRRIKFKESLDSAVVNSFLERLQNILDFDTTTRNALDSIGAFDLSVKREDSDSEPLTSPPSSEWLRCQAAAYAAITIEARYDLCLCLIILLFFLSEDLRAWDASLLAEIFAVFRGLAMLRFVVNQPAEAKTTHQSTSPSSDDVIIQMRNMNVSNSKPQIASKSSLIYHLIPPSSASDGIASVAHNFLDSTGVLQSLSPAHVTKHEILFCNRVKTLGFCNTTRELLSWLPRTPAATFLQSQVMLVLGRVDDASQLLEKLSGCFGMSYLHTLSINAQGSAGVNNLTLEDSDALASVLPSAQPMSSQFEFYLFVADLFRNHNIHQEIHFSQLAIQVAPHGTETIQLWNAVVKGLTDLALYEDAYAAVMAMPFEKQFVVSFVALTHHTQRIRTGKRNAQATLPFACVKTTQSRSS